MRGVIVISREGGVVGRREGRHDARAVAIPQPPSPPKPRGGLLQVSFIAALLCIRWLIRYVSSHNFTIFAWYRIALGVLILLVMW